MGQSDNSKRQETISNPSMPSEVSEVYDAVSGEWIPIDDIARRALVQGKPLASKEVRRLAARNTIREHDESSDTMFGLPKQVSPDRLDSGPLAQFNRGLVSGGVLGEPTSREFLTNQLKSIGTPVAETDPEGWHEQGSRYAGTALGAVPGLYSIAKSPIIKAWGKVNPVFGTLLSLLTKQFERKGIGAAAAALASETAAGYGAGVGQEVGGPIGSAVGSAVPTGVAPLFRMLPLPTTVRVAKRESRRIRDLIEGASTPEGRSQQSQDLAQMAETELGGLARKAVDDTGTFDPTSLPGQQIQRVMQNQIGEPGSPQVMRILKNLDEKPLIGTETVAQRTGDKLLIDIERKNIARKGRTPSEASDVKQRQEQSELVRRVEREGTVEDARLKSAQLLEEASGSLSEPVEQLSRTDIATKLSGNIVKSKRNAKIEEARVWQKAENDSGNLTFPTNPLIERWIRQLYGVEKAKRQDIPSVIFRLIPEGKQNLDFGEIAPVPGSFPEWPRASALADSESAFQIQGVVSVLKEVARLSPGSNQARIAKMLSDSADEFLEEQLKSLQADSNAYNSLMNARSFTRNLHESFDRNPKIAKLTQGSAGREELAINPELVFEKLGFSSGPGIVTSANANTLRQVLDASAYGRSGASLDVTGRAINQDAIDSVNDFLMQGFLEKTDSGRNFTQIQKFIRSHRDLWDANRFPELQKLSNSLSSIAKLAERSEAVDKLEGSVSKIFKAGNPISVFNSINKIRPRGPARLSLDSDLSLWRTAILRKVMRDSKTGELLPQSGKSLLSALDDPRINPLFRRLFTKAEVDNLRVLARGIEVRDLSIIYDPKTGQVIPGASDYVDLDESDLTTEAVTGGITRASRLLGSWVSQLPPFSFIRGGASLTVAGTTASTGQSIAKNVLTRNQEMAIQEIIKSKQNVIDVLTKPGELDAPTMSRLMSMAKKLWEFLEYPDPREIVPNAMRQGLVPFAKTQLDKKDPQGPISYSPR